MPWFRSPGGRLVHSPEGGVHGLAAVLRAKGYRQVSDGEAEAEVASGEAQVRADVEAEVSAGVDQRVVPGDPPKVVVPVDVPGVGKLEFAVGGTPDTSAEVEAKAQQALAEEAPRTTRRKQKG